MFNWNFLPFLSSSSFSGNFFLNLSIFLDAFAMHTVPLIFYGIQHYLSISGSIILIPLIIVPAMGGSDVSSQQKGVIMLMRNNERFNNFLWICLEFVLHLTGGHCKSCFHCSSCYWIFDLNALLPWFKVAIGTRSILCVSCSSINDYKLRWVSKHRH